MDGLLFYWLSWIALIVLLFFVSERSMDRYQVSIHLLIFIILSRYSIEVVSFTLQLSGLYLFLIICFSIRKLPYPKLIQFIFSNFILALAYASFYLFVILDPVWVFIDSKYLLMIFMNYLVILLFKEWKLRIALLLIGMALGDVLYSFVLIQQGLPYYSLSFVWHDQVALCVMAQLVWIFGEWFSRQFHKFIQFKFPARQKQNQSVR